MIGVMPDWGCEHRGSGQRGFSLLEVLVTLAITVGVLLAAAGAVANSLHAVALSDRKMALEDDALSVLADVRAATGYANATPNRYASSFLAKVTGHTATMTLDGRGVAETLTLSVKPKAGNGAASQGVVAVVTASADGVAVTESQTLGIEAPSPGSSVDQP